MEGNVLGNLEAEELEKHEFLQNVVFLQFDSFHYMQK
jgi:hypothetical protein